MTKFLRIAIVLCLLGVGAAAQDFVPQPQEPVETEAVFVDGQILVRFSDDMTQSDIVTAASARNCVVIGESPTGAYKLLATPAGMELELADDFANDPDCLWASANYLTQSHGRSRPFPPDDPFFPFQRHLELINLEGVNSRSDDDDDDDDDDDGWRADDDDDGGRDDDDDDGGRRNVVVAVIDSGVAFEDRVIPANELGGVLPGKTDYFRAPDLMQTQFLPGFDFINGDSNPNDDRNHGTTVTAVIAQDTNNAFGAAGIAPDSAIIPIKGNNFLGNGSLASLIDSINFATDSDADVINMSLGFPAVLTLPVFDANFLGLDEALQRAHDAGIVIIASSGNEGVGVVSRPAANPNVIAVGATNYDGLTRAGYSQSSLIEPAFGIVPARGLPGQIEIVGPVGDFSDSDGDTIPDAVIQESFFQNCPDDFAFLLNVGTSFSAPQVAAVASLMIAEGRRPRKDGISVEIIRQVLRETAVDFGDVGDDLEFGAGQLDAGAAVNARKVTVCRIPPGNPSNARTKSVGLSSAHFLVRKGSLLGPCPE